MIDKFIQSHNETNENLQSVVQFKLAMYHGKLELMTNRLHSISDAFINIQQENKCLKVSLVETRTVVAELQEKERTSNEHTSRLEEELAISKAASSYGNQEDSDNVGCPSTGSANIPECCSGCTLMQERLMEKEGRLSRVMAQMSDTLALLLQSEARETEANKQIAQLRALVDTDPSNDMGTMSTAVGEVLSAENDDLRIRLGQAESLITKQNIEITSLQSKLTTLRMLSRNRSTGGGDAEEQIYSLSMQLQQARDEITQLHSALDEYEKTPGWTPTVLCPVEEVEDEDNIDLSLDVTKQRQLEEEEFVMKSRTYLRLVSQLRDLNDRLDQESKWRIETEEMVFRLDGGRLDLEQRCMDLENERTALLDELSSRQMEGRAVAMALAEQNHVMHTIGSMLDDDTIVDDNEFDNEEAQEHIVHTTSTRHKHPADPSGRINTTTASASTASSNATATVTTGNNSHHVNHHQYVTRIKELESRLKEVEIQGKQHQIDLRVSQALLLDAQTSEKCAKEKAYEKDIEITSLRHEFVETKRSLDEDLNLLEVTLQLKDEKIADSSDIIKNLEIQMNQLQEELNETYVSLQDLQTTERTSRDAVESLSTTNEQLQQELTACKTRLLETEDRVKFDINLLSQKNDRIKELEANIDGIELQLKSIQDEFSSATVLLEESKVKEELSAHKINELQTEKCDLEGLVVDLKKQISDMGSDVSSHTKDLKALQSKHEEDLSRLESELSQTVKDLEDSKVRIRTSQTREVDAEEKSADLLEQLEQLQLEVEQYKKTGEELNAQLVSTKQELRDIQELFENTVGGNEAIISTLRVQIRDMQSQMKKKNDNMKGIEDIEAQLMHCKQDLDNSKATLRDALNRESTADRRIEGLCTELEESKSILSSVRQELEDSKVVLEEAQNTESMAQEQITELKRLLTEKSGENVGVIAVLEARLQEALNGCEEKDVITNELNSVLKELDIQLTTCQEELLQMKVELTSSQQMEIELRTSLTTVNEEVKGLQEQLHMSQNNHIFVQENLVQIKRELSDCQISLHTKNTQLIENETELNNNKSSLIDCQSLLKRIETQIAEMEVELEGSKSSLTDCQMLIEERNSRLVESENSLQKTEDDLIETTRLLEESKQEHIKTEERVIYLQSQVEDLTVALKEENDRVHKESDEQLSAANMTILDLQERETSALEKVQILTDELNAALQGLSGCQTLLEKRAVQLAESDAMVVSIRQQLLETRSMLQDSQSKIVDGEQEMTVLRSELIETHKMLNEKKIQRAENERLLCAVQQELGATKVILEEEMAAKTCLEKAFKDIQARLEGSQRELSDYQKQLEERDSIIVQLEHQIADVQQLFEVTIGSHEEKINDLCQRLKQTETGMDVLQTQVQKKTAQLTQTENQLTSTAQELMETKNALQECRKREAACKDVNSDLTSQLKDLKASVVDLKSLLESSDATIAELHSNWNSTVMDLADCQALLQTKEVQLETACRETDDVRSQMNDMSSTLSEYKSQLLVKANQVLELENQLKKIEEVIQFRNPSAVETDTDTQISDICSELEHVKTLLKDSQLRENAAEDRIAELRSNWNSTVMGLADCQALLQTKEVQLTEMEAHLSSIRSELSESKTLLSKATSGVEADRRNEELISRLTEAQSKEAMADEVIKDLQQQLHDTQTDLICCRDLLRDQELVLAEMENELTRYRNELQSPHNSSHGNRVDSSSNSDEKQALLVVELQGKLEETEQRLRVNVSVVIEKGKRVNELEEKLKIKDTQLTSIQQEIQQLKLQTVAASNVAKNDQMVQLESELKDTISCLADCQSLLHSKDKQVEEMEKRLLKHESISCEKEEAMNDLRIRLHAADAQCASFRRELEETRSQLHDLRMAETIADEEIRSLKARLQAEGRR